VGTQVARPTIKVRLGRGSLSTRAGRSDALWAYAMLAPSFLGLLIFEIWPILQTFYFSFTEWGVFGNYEWKGLDNYRTLLEDPDFPLALRNTLTYMFLTVAIGVAISIVLAVLLNQKIRGISIYRTLYFLPVITMPAAVGIVWRWLYNSDYGLINHVLGAMGMQEVRWLTDPSLALYSIIVVGVWSSIGYNMVLLLAGLQTIPREYYEAASVDGAGAAPRFFRITLPLLSPTIFFVTIIQLINSLQVFDLIYLMVGAPEVATASPAIRETQSLVYIFFKNSFVSNNQGYGAAVIVVLFLLILGLTATGLRSQKRWVHYA
jgi:multiple sugar transport system permease protein